MPPTQVDALGMTGELTLAENVFPVAPDLNTVGLYCVYAHLETSPGHTAHEMPRDKHTVNLFVQQQNFNQKGPGSGALPSS